MHRKEIDELTDHAESEHHAEIFLSVFRISCALRDHISKNGERQAADHAHPFVRGIYLMSDMVDGHGNKGDDLKLIAR